MGDRDYGRGFGRSSARGFERGYDGFLGRDYDQRLDPFSGRDYERGFDRVREYDQSFDRGRDHDRSFDHGRDYGRSLGRGPGCNRGPPDRDYDRGYRSSEFRSITGDGNGNRRLEIVRGSVFSANQMFVTPPRHRSPEPPALPHPPGRRGSRGHQPARSFDAGGLSSSSPSSSSAWFLNDAEMKRRRRVAGYKAYGVQGKVKASLRRGLRWIKGKCSKIVHGW